MSSPIQTPEIRWHFGPTGLNEAILSVDFLSHTLDDAEHSILASGGADKEVKLWSISKDKDKNKYSVEYIHSFTGHDRSINSVRFSPNGECLASASDDGTIIVWVRPKNASMDWSWKNVCSNSDVTRIILSCGHKGDVIDVSWSPDSSRLCSASVDNKAIIWKLPQGKIERIISDNNQYVQGVAWDPQSKFLATQGNDRTCRIFSLFGYSEKASEECVNKEKPKRVTKKCVCIHTHRYRAFKNQQSHVNKENMVNKQNTPEHKSNQSQEKQTEADEEVKKNGTQQPMKFQQHRMYYDDTLISFFRKLTWTPDGSFLLTPAGLYQQSSESPLLNTVYGFSRDMMEKPIFHLPGSDKPALAVRCSPILYKLHGTREANPFKLCYRMIIAVVTLDSLIVYDTEQLYPIITMSNMHYADVTDLSWSADGSTIVLSSLDGYCSFINVPSLELGEPLNPIDIPLWMKREHQSIYMRVKTPKKTQKPNPDIRNTLKQSPSGHRLPYTRDLPSSEKKVNTLTVKKKRKATSSLQSPESQTKIKNTNTRTIKITDLIARKQDKPKSPSNGTSVSTAIDIE